MITKQMQDIDDEISAAEREFRPVHSATSAECAEKPTLVEWCGRRIDEMSREELIHALEEAVELANELLRRRR